MKKFIQRCILFSIPLWIYASIIILIDPFNYFNSTLVINQKDKQSISENIDIRYWKIMNYQNKKSKNIILGDSRSNFPVEYIEEKTGKGFYNFSIYASTIEEMTDIFWYVSKQTDLETVYIGLNFNHYNKYNNKNLLIDKIQKSNLVSYIFENASYKASYNIIQSKLTGKINKKGMPDMSKEKFWKQQLDTEADKYYSLYKYPGNYYKKLEEIAAYCKEKNIKLLFFSPPTHIDLQNKIKEYKLEKEFERFKSDLKSLGTWVDFDYPSELTQDKNKFTDPFHLDPDLRYRIITDDLLNEKGKHSIRYSRKD
jgi:uncharacterized protein (DUF2164 family)